MMPRDRGGIGGASNGVATNMVILQAARPADSVAADAERPFRPRTMGDHHGRHGRVDEILLSLTARALTTGEISTHFHEVHRANVSTRAARPSSNKYARETQFWLLRPLEASYVRVSIHALVVGVDDRDGSTRPFYAAIGIDAAGNHDVLGIWAGMGGGETPDFWLAILVNLKSRGVVDVFFLVYDGLNSLPASVEPIWPETVVQSCIVHLLRDKFRSIPPAVGSRR